MYSVDIYNRVRRACLKDGMSAREAARYFNKDRKTIAKMLRHALPPGYRRSEAPRRPTLDDYVGVIDEILRTVKWSGFLGQFCGLAKMHLVCVHAAFRISAWPKYAMSGVRLSRAV
jgi:hypothetical protein